MSGMNGREGGLGKGGFGEGGGRQTMVVVGRKEREQAQGCY